MPLDHGFPRAGRHVDRPRSMRSMESDPRRLVNNTALLPGSTCGYAWTSPFEESAAISSLGSPPFAGTRSKPRFRPWPTQWNHRRPNWRRAVPRRPGRSCGAPPATGTLRSSAAAEETDPLAVRRNERKAGVVVPGSVLGSMSLDRADRSSFGLHRRWRRRLGRR